MKKQKSIAILLSAIMLAGCMAGCGDSDKTTPSNTGGSSGTAGEASKEPITLTAFKNGVAAPENWTWGQDPSSKKITEETGVTIEVSYAATNDNTEINTMLASGEKLPDFIITDAHGPVRPLLVDQGFAMPLNELADQYDKSFWDVLPKDMDKVYQEQDGNFYCVVDWYGDENKYGDQILNSRGPVSFSIKKEYYEELGRPDVSTMEKYMDVVKQIKEKHPEINHPIWTDQAITPWSSSNMVNVIARMYGATNNFFHFNGDEVEMVFTQPYYKEALKTVNQMYQQGLFNPEQFAYKSDQNKGFYRSQDMISFVGYYWNLIEGLGNQQDVIYETIEFPMPEGKKPEDLKIHDDYFGVGGTGTFISKDTKNPDRCIQYLNFMLSLDGQLIQRYGVEGVTWEKDEDGRPRENDAKREAEQKGIDVLQRDMGVYNYNFSWLTSNWILVYGAHNTYKSYPCMIPDFEIMTPHQQNERFADLTYSITDTEQLVLKEQIFDIWKQGVAKICSAETDAEFEDAYKQFISDVNKANVETLNGYFTESAAHWKEVGLA